MNYPGSSVTPPKPDSHLHAVHSHASHSHAGHDHGISEAPAKALRWALALTSCILVAEAVGGWLANSLALISDAAHMLTDTAALAIALAAIHLSRRAADTRRTYGYARFEILAATFNASILFLVALYILWEAIDRFRHPPEVQSATMMGIAIVGLIANLTSMLILRAHSQHSLNIKGAYLEVWSDMLGSLGVLAAGAIIHLTGWKPIDPIIAVLIGLWVLPRTWVILKDSLNILLEGVPPGINTDAISEAILRVPGVSGLHDLHVWGVSTNRLLLTAHVARDTLPDITDTDVLSAIHKLLNEQFQIAHCTIQLEHTTCGSPDCHDQQNVH